MTLATTALRRDTVLTQAALVLAGTLFIALAAKISVPMYPVPVTLQTLAILLVGFALGARLGAVTLLAYLAEGAMGLPVFSSTTAPGLLAFVGPTAGFLVGFVAMAWAAGFVADRGVRGVVPVALAALVISAALYVPGLAWPYGVASLVGVQAGWAGLGLESLVSGWMLPFLIGDALKAVLAAVLIAGGWSWMAKRQG